MENTEAYKMGFNTAINMAIQWLNDNILNYVWFDEAEASNDNSTGLSLDFEQDFKNAMTKSECSKLIEVKVKPVMGYYKSCGFVATEIELQDYGVICKNGEGKIYINLI